jgi:hypothetical protein
MLLSCIMFYNVAFKCEEGVLEMMLLFFMSCKNIEIINAWKCKILKLMLYSPWHVGYMLAWLFSATAEQSGASR